MSEKSRVNVGRLHASKCKIHFQFAAPLLKAPCTCIDQDRAATATATATNQVTINMNRRWIVHTCGVLQL